MTKVTESERLHLLNVRTLSEAKSSNLMLRRLAKYWMPKGSSHLGSDIRLDQAGLGMFSHFFYPASFFFSLFLSLVFFALWGVLSGVGVFFCSLYFFLFRLVTYLSIERRIAFNQHLSGFVSGLEMRVTEGQKLNSAFEFVLERAPEGVLRTELDRASNRGNLKSSIVGLSERIVGKESNIFASSIFIMTGVYDLQQKGVSKISRLLKSSLENFNKRVEFRRVWYRAVWIFALICLAINIFVVLNSGELLAKPVLELCIVLQLFGLLVATGFADRIVGAE